MESPTRKVVAANIRARMAWAAVSPGEVQLLMGWTRRTTYNKLHAISPLTPDEIATLATKLECDAGDLFVVPESFSSPSACPASMAAAA